MPGCSEDDRDTLGRVTGDTLAQRSATMAHVRDYSVESQSTVSLLADQVSPARASLKPRPISLIMPPVPLSRGSTACLDDQRG